MRSSTMIDDGDVAPRSLAKIEGAARVKAVQIETAAFGGSFDLDFAPPSYVYSAPHNPLTSSALHTLHPTSHFPPSTPHFIMAPSATHSNAAPDGTRPGDVHRNYLDDRAARAEGLWQICLLLGLAD